MHDFTFNGVSLSSLGGRIVQPPFHTVATRNVERVKIYGQSGDEIIDNESYDNVDFSLSICFMPLLAESTARELAYAVIDWLAPLQNGYYTYRDTYNPGYFTKAVLKNIDQVVRELPVLLTTTLNFVRVPFWYSDVGQNTTTVFGGSAVQINNPEKYPSEPYYIFETQRTEETDAHITINGETVSFAVSHENPVHRFANKQHFRLYNGGKIYFGTELLPDLQPGVNSVQVTTSYVVSGSFWLEIRPNWRRL
jgi:phage-related protein